MERVSLTTVSASLMLDLSSLLRVSSSDSRCFCSFLVGRRRAGRLAEGAAGTVTAEATAPVSAARDASVAVEEEVASAAAEAVRLAVLLVSATGAGAGAGISMSETSSSRGMLTPAVLPSRPTVARSEKQSGRSGLASVVAEKGERGGVRPTEEAASKAKSSSASLMSGKSRSACDEAVARASSSSPTSQQTRLGAGACLCVAAADAVDGHEAEAAEARSAAAAVVVEGAMLERGSAGGHLARDITSSSRSRPGSATTCWKERRMLSKLLVAGEEGREGPELTREMERKKSSLRAAAAAAAGVSAALFVVVVVVVDDVMDAEPRDSKRREKDASEALFRRANEVVAATRGKAADAIVHGCDGGHVTSNAEEEDGWMGGLEVA